ncbi:hypothetical protein [Massilia niabensis]|uniref:Lipoprotein n=1 Tax=Massilia niabensis TaxID=544910 RepID=A0ABW0L2J9_9BURK
MNNRHFLLSATAVLVLSACGGGGGGGGGSTPPPPPVSTHSPVTPANATRVASNAYAAASAIGDSSTSLNGFLTGVSVGRANISVVSPVLKLVKQAYARDGQPLLTGVTLTEACTGGGTITIDATVRSQDTISNGDAVKITANNCVEDGDTLNGVLGTTFSNITGDMLNSWTWTATMDARFTQFSIRSGSETVSVNGDMKIAMIQTNATTSSVTVSGSSLQTTEQRSGMNLASRNLSDYSMTGSTRGSTVTSTASFTMSGNTSALGQFSYSVRNLQPFVTNGTGMPSAGALIVEGASSSVTLTVASATGVRLDLSAKGDGVITQTTNLAWAEFLMSI